jgi:hypothetical protein
LRDGALYITKLPKAEHSVAEWQAAMECLILVAEKNGPTMMARIGIMRALNRYWHQSSIAPILNAPKNSGLHGSVCWIEEE